MNRYLTLLLVVATCVPCFATDEVTTEHAEKMKAGLAVFSGTIRPALEQHCLKCHGGEKTRGGFNLGSREGLLAGADSGPVVDLDSPSDSLLLTLIRHQEEPFMPAKQPKLNDKLIAAFERWIQLGAPYDEPLIDGPIKNKALTVTESDRAFWSFTQFVKQAPPKTDNSWVRNDIDRFIVNRQQQAGVSPNPAATKRTLARRAYLDLLGLPPSPQELDAFLADQSSDAWSRLIDRLLASQHYGERQARYWMDVARFAESFGFEQNYDRPNAFHYRDFLIHAFNDDMPWDQLVRWQLAGDELAPDDARAWMATGFLVAGVFPTQITQAEFEQTRYDELDDMISTTGAAFLGLSIGCARCHDHKYDPIPIADYYRFAATFATAIRCETQAKPIRSDLYTTAHKTWQSKLDSLDARLAKAKNDKERSRVTKDRKGHLAKEPKDGKIDVMVCSEGLSPMKNHADGRGYPHFYPQVHHLNRGDPKQKKHVAEQGFLQVLMPHQDAADRWKRDKPEGSKSSHRRAALASWITDPAAGSGRLLARVIVNRIWQQHFGRGIVATPNDFGFQGERPTHPDLLDWLAKDLVDNGWSLKRLHKQIMLSATYRQNADYDTADATKDIDNNLHWRFEPRRLEAEPIRDSLLAVSGLLDPTPFGPGSKSESMRRRSIYFTIKRSQLPNVMIVFDWPEHLVSIGKRPTTTVASQSLYMMNSPQVRSYATALAQRAEGSVDRIYQIALGRVPTANERDAANAFLKQQETKYGNSSAALTDFCLAVMASNEFLYLP